MSALLVAAKSEGLAAVLMGVATSRHEGALASATHRRFAALFAARLSSVMYWYQVCNGSVWALTWAATCAAPILSTLLLLNGFRAVSHPALVMGTGRYTRARCSSILG
ncbi:hypothetical protein V8C86DRAFT_2886706, partial [Haematococcus lacustris]